MVAYTGAVAPEAIEAVGLIGESRRDVGLLAVTSADRLHAGWTAARKLRRDRRGVQHLSHIEKLLAPLPRDCGIVTVIDGHPATLGWLGSVRGHRVEALGVEHFGQTGTDRRPLPPPRHGRQRHHRCGRKPHRRRPGAAPQNGGVMSLGWQHSRRRPRGAATDTAAVIVFQGGRSACLTNCVPLWVWAPGLRPADDGRTALAGTRE